MNRTETLISYLESTTVHISIERQHHDTYFLASGNVIYNDTEKTLILTCGHGVEWFFDFAAEVTFRVQFYGESEARDAYLISFEEHYRQEVALLVCKCGKPRKFIDLCGVAEVVKGMDLYMSSYCGGLKRISNTSGMLSQVEIPGHLYDAVIPYFREYVIVSEHGSSGAAVVNELGQLVAVHVKSPLVGIKYTTEFKDRAISYCLRARGDFKLGIPDYVVRQIIVELSCSLPSTSTIEDRLRFLIAKTFLSKGALKKLQKKKQLSTASEAHSQRRTVFEDAISKTPWNVVLRVKYADWEESHGEIEQAMSIWDDILEVDNENLILYRKYADFLIRERDYSRARQVYEEALSKFYSVKQLWVDYAYLEESDVGDLVNAREIYERFMRHNPDEKGWNCYIDFELRYFTNACRVRDLYESFVCCHSKIGPWVQFAKFEKRIGQPEKSRAIYELVTRDPKYSHLDKPELWKEYINFELFEGEYEKVRTLYEKFVAKTNDVSMWINYAQFEALTINDGLYEYMYGYMEVDEDEDEEREDAFKETKKSCLFRSRAIFERAFNHYGSLSPPSSEDQALLLQEWLCVEKHFGKLGDPASVEAKMPK